MISVVPLQAVTCSLLPFLFAEQPDQAAVADHFNLSSAEIVAGFDCAIFPGLSGRLDSDRRSLGDLIERVFDF